VVVDTRFLPSTKNRGAFAFERNLHPSQGTGIDTLLLIHPSSGLEVWMAKIRSCQIAWMTLMAGSCPSVGLDEQLKMLAQSQRLGDPHAE